MARTYRHRPRRQPWRPTLRPRPQPPARHWLDRYEAESDEHEGQLAGRHGAEVSAPDQHRRANGNRGYED